MSFASVAPTPITVGKLPGVFAEPCAGPPPPIGKTGIIPAFFQFKQSCQNSSEVVAVEPHEFDPATIFTP